MTENRQLMRERLREIATDIAAYPDTGLKADKAFYDELCEFMASAPVVAQVLEGEGAIAKNREVMGATNPADAAPGTIRAEFAQSVGENSVHGSDAPETAAAEIAYFFSGLELVG